MRVTDEGQLRLSWTANRPNQGETGSTSSSFGDLFSQALDAKGDEAAAAGTMITASSACLAAVETGGTSSESSPLYQQMDDLLASLETYGQALGDAGTTLRELAPLVNDISRQAEELAVGLESEATPELADLARQVTAQAQAEVIKFRRGDYV